MRDVIATATCQAEIGDNFEKFQKPMLEKIMSEAVNCSHIIDDENDITPEMNKKHILVPSIQNPGKAVLISRAKDNSKKIKDILE